jgi:hypothetical protein
MAMINPLNGTQPEAFNDTGVVPYGGALTTELTSAQQEQVEPVRLSVGKLPAATRRSR